MVWFVQPLQKKGADGDACGVWHLCAKSDEDGGFHAGCDHDHKSAEEAQACLEARKAVGVVTGFPLMMDKITINGIVWNWPHDDPISHERICELALHPPYASVTYIGPRTGDSQRSGLTAPGDSIKTVDGMRINCVVTGNA